MSKSPSRDEQSYTVSNLEEKPRLSEHEKKANHIASGQFYLPEIKHLLHHSSLYHMGANFES